MAGERHVVAGMLLISCLFTAFLYAQQQVPPSRPGWPCVAGRAIDPTSIRTAEATAGYPHQRVLPRLIQIQTAN